MPLDKINIEFKKKKEEEKMPWSFIKFSQLILYGNCMEISLENLYVDIGA